MQTEIIKFRPSNGTEGELFITGWCGNCARDKSCSEGINIDDCAEEELCEIIGKTMRFSLDDPEYPEEWQFNNVHKLPDHSSKPGAVTVEGNVTTHKLIG